MHVSHFKIGSKHRASFNEVKIQKSKLQPTKAGRDESGKAKAVKTLAPKQKSTSMKQNKPGRTQNRGTGETQA